MKTLKFDGEELYLEVRQYMNERIAILAYTKDDMYGDVTINLPGMSLDNEHGGFINSYTKDGGLEAKLIKEGVIEKVVGTVKYNMGKYDEVVFNIEKLKEYDKEGVEKYLQIEEEEEQEFE